ncbi:telomerase reverse transcriptase isoform X2 [Hoplias malabaricus]|uniref:telomerase reverse transcriptase isoform X2 n=1 Tax=Hoplias malabaricus TaxID=27720 RepID=UPI0034637E8D
MGGIERALSLLECVYPCVRTLPQFSECVQYSNGHKVALLQDSDPERLKTLIRGLVVCSDTRFPQSASHAQLATLPEVLAFVLNQMKRRRKRNVLNFGYHYSDSAGNFDPFKFHGTVSQSAALVSGSELWVRINQRLGTEVTQHLLQDCSVFTTAPPSCLVQLCGVPLYDLLPLRQWTGFFITCSSLGVGASSQTQGNYLVRKKMRGKKRNRGVEQGYAVREQGNQVQERKTRGKKRCKKIDHGFIVAGKGRDVRVEEEGWTQGGGKKRKRKVKDEEELDTEEKIKAKKKCFGSVEHREPLIETEAALPKWEKLAPSSTTMNYDIIEQSSHSLIELPLKVDRVQLNGVESTSLSPAPKVGMCSWKPSDQSPARPSHCSIRVLSMLYCGRGMKGFLLNRKLRRGVEMPRRIQGADLVRIIFLQGTEYLSGAVEPKPRRLPKRFFGMEPLFGQMLRQHRKCPYAHFLRKKCSCKEGEGEGQEDMTSLLTSHCSPYRVYLFVRECLRYVIPNEFWGSEHNLLTFLSHVKHLLRLGKFERMSLAQVMWRMKVSDCHWLGHKKRHCPSEQRYREWILAQFLMWMMNSFVLGLVKALFYVTETMGRKHALRFYRREIWTKLQQLAFREHLSKGQWETLSPQQVASLPKSIVMSRIRFIPKTSSMRPITRLSGSGPTLQFQSGVRDLQNVLSLCVRERPSLLGSTVWGKQDIHKVLRSIKPQHAKITQPMYFVKVDISGAYDSLPHAKLLEVVGEVLDPVQDFSFSLRHYAKVWRDSTLGIRKQFCTKVGVLEMMNMKGFAVEEQSSGRLHNSVLVERFSTEVRGADVLQFFKQMLSSCVIQHDRKWFRQVCGVPQGSAVSTMLCNLCYGHMENSLLKNLTDKGGCLMRLVDDFLLITPSHRKALTFLRTLLAGIPDYGCEINPRKVAVNFPVCEEPVVPEISQYPLQCLFPWCGLLIDTRSLSVYNDYSGYAGQSLRYSLTLGSAPSPAVFMRRKLLAVLRLKCDQIFLDLRLNSVEAVYRNTYQILLLQALRFHVCVKSLPLGQTVNTNPNFFLNIIWSTATVISKSLTHSNTDDEVVCGVLGNEVVELLCCLAFGAVLTRYRLCYCGLLPRLQRRKRHLCNVLQGMKLARVLQVATPRIPHDFAKIRT